MSPYRLARLHHHGKITWRAAMQKLSKRQRPLFIEYAYELKQGRRSRVADVLRDRRQVAR